MLFNQGWQAGKPATASCMKEAWGGWGEDSREIELLSVWRFPRHGYVEAIA